MAKPLEQKVRQWGRGRYRLPLVALCGLGVFAAFSGVAQAHPTADGTQRKVRKASPAPPVELVPVVVATPPPPPPPPPLTPGQLPPNPPSVSYENGQLRIVAENSTLADILSAVSIITGAAMDVPSGAGAERVWVQVGPGPARAILAELLGGADLDYVIQAADTDPTLIQSVLLTPRNKGNRVSDPTGGTQSYASRMSNRFRTRSSSGTPESSDSDSASSPDTPTVSADGDGSGIAVQSNPQPTDTPSAQAGAQSAAADASSPPSPTDTPNASLSARLPLAITEADAHPAPITNPEQGIPQLLNLFELRRQLQQQQNAQQKAATTR